MLQDSQLAAFIEKEYLMPFLAIKIISNAVKGPFWRYFKHLNKLEILGSIFIKKKKHVLILEVSF